MCDAPARDGGDLAGALPVVQDAKSLCGVRRLEHRSDATVLVEQECQFFESGFLVVHSENDQTSGTVVAVHDLLILRVRRSRQGDARTITRPPPPTMVTANRPECQGALPIGIPVSGYRSDPIDHTES
ncbi:hypothetical protein GCM10023403_52790 [Pseudonocardia benzenivorans]